MQSAAQNGWNSEHYDQSDQIADFFFVHTDGGEDNVQYQQLTCLV